MHQAVEEGPLPLRLLDRIADDDETARQDLDVIRIAPKTRGPVPDVDVILLCTGQPAAARRKNHLDGLGGELAAGIRCAGLDDDRQTLDGWGDVLWPTQPL